MAGTIEYRKICFSNLSTGTYFGENRMLSVPLHPYDSKSWIAHIKHLVGRKRNPRAESAEAHDFFNLAIPIDSVNLAGFTTRPQISLVIEGTALRMIEPLRINLE